MNLTIDIGNTRSKIVLFCNDQVQEAFAVESDLCEAVQKVMQTYDIQAVAWSAVGRIPEGFEAMLCKLKASCEFFCKLIRAENKVSFGNCELTDTDKTVHFA